MHVFGFARSSIFLGVALTVFGASGAYGRGAVVDETTGINFANCTNNICVIPLGLTVDFGAGPVSTLAVSNRGLFALGNADLGAAGTKLSDFGQTVFSPAFTGGLDSNFTYRGPNPSANNNPNAFKLRYDVNQGATTVQFIIRPTGVGNGFELEYAYGFGEQVDLGANTVIGYSFGPADYEVKFGDPGISDRVNDQQNASFLFRFPLAAPVPEPATWALMLIGFASAGVAVRRFARKPLLAS